MPRCACCRLFGKCLSDAMAFALALLMRTAMMVKGDNQLADPIAHAGSAVNLPIRHGVDGDAAIEDGEGTVQRFQHLITR